MAISIAVDVTERKQEKEELEEHCHHLEKLVSARTAELARPKIPPRSPTSPKVCFYQFVTGLQAGGFRRGGVCIPSTTHPQALPFRAGGAYSVLKTGVLNRVGIRIKP
jgi:hypothetical protein